MQQTKDEGVKRSDPFYRQLMKDLGQHAKARCDPKLFPTPLNKHEASLIAQCPVSVLKANGSLPMVRRSLKAFVANVENGKVHASPGTVNRVKKARQPCSIKQQQQRLRRYYPLQNYHPENSRQQGSK